MFGKTPRHRLRSADPDGQVADATESAEYEEFDKQRIADAYYWAAQAQGFLDETIHGPNDYGVAIVGGKVVIFIGDKLPDGSVDTLEYELADHGFPLGWSRSPCENGERLYLIPTDKRLVSQHEEDWQEFENDLGAIESNVNSNKNSEPTDPSTNRQKYPS
jgi:hypothetical protein